uniref:AAA-ATPase At3g50940-like n=1 Tax=Tanacetum cinerariifolium TaxID=118510 RepID=A0A6L2LAL5_TANCI|nr:AAA-ATPase At3g50940-like [Tanacetum cinerariifolium]
MDSDVKDTVMKDLDRFLERREFYREVGKVWKRCYLLYGPPGTEMDLLAFIHVADPTNVRVFKRERAEGEAKILDSTVGRVES